MSGLNNVNISNGDYQYSMIDTSVYERIPVEVHESPDEASKYVARKVVETIQRNEEQGSQTVLGLATGSTPIRVYDELIRLHKEEGVSFKHVVTFNLDEYYPIEPTAKQSYVRFMDENLFNHIDIKKENVHVPDGTLDRDEIGEYCGVYEKKIKEAGGLDLQLLGIGRTGHIGFNEPGSVKRSRTRLITLDALTRKDAAGDFFGEENVPRQAITMGIGTILESKQIILMAWGEHKAKIIGQAVEGPISEQVPATFLQDHPNTIVILDNAAASQLTREKTPWLVGSCQWTESMVKKAVVWLCTKLDKPVLKLTDEDYNENGLGDLITYEGPAYGINLAVFNQIQHTITGWPGGKPSADDTYRPERAKPFPKKVLIFSPHPDDDVFSMGGTLMRLVEHGHTVDVAYQTSGSNGIYDDEAIRFADFVIDYHKAFGLETGDVQKVFKDIREYLSEKTLMDVDTKELRKIKGLIREGEAKAVCRYVGIPLDRVHFLNMPFYETGGSRKKPLSDADIDIMVSLLQKIKPHQIYAAGDLSDPHGTHRICLEALKKALRQVKEEAWFDDCYVWLYRGAWQEWEVHEIEMAVPLSPGELNRKRNAVFK
ncbi:MAG TPA: glucosamine-6-phosphate deaminase, partial [Balneolaceae bacterium]|nr:glucosamine-6-phosphate deaminase [Balneolaceae bacterium]